MIDPIDNVKEVPLPAHSHQYIPSHAEIAKLAYTIWECDGGGWTSQAEADDNWYAAIAVIRTRHCG